MLLSWKNYTIQRFRPTRCRRGSFLPAILMVATIMMIFATAVLSMLLANLKTVNKYNLQISATNIAEAGLNYYLWHLSHNPNDYWDGCSANISDPCRTLSADGYYGPYTHNYTDASSHAIGTFEIVIYPPDVQNASVKVKSTGRNLNSSLNKTIIANLGMPYFSKYFLLSFTDEVWVGSTETVNGPVHVNNPSAGIRNQGSIGKATTTCVTQYNSPSDNNNAHDCVWGEGTFTQGFQFPAASFDIANVDFGTLSTASQLTGNVNYPENNTNGAKGYHIILKGDRYDLKKVQSVTTNDGQYVGDWNTSRIPDTIATEQSYLTDQPFPTNGLIFFQDDVWVEGYLQDKKVTIVASKTNGNAKKIFIPNNISYHERNSTTKLGLIAQKSIQITYGAPSTLNIDAAMLARDDYVFFPYYDQVLKASLSIFGSIAHQGGLIFSWATSDHPEDVLSGFQLTNYNHDSDLIFAPPPYFPKSNQYEIKNWHEE